MANVKITDLTAYTDAASTDVLPIVDVSNNVTKKISIADLLKASPLGSAAAPGIAFDGDPNTGVYSPGADQVAISTNGAGRLFVDASGNVGLGGVPGNIAGYQTFRQVGSSGSTFEQYAGATLTGSITTDTQLTINAVTAIPISLKTSNTERLRITSAGLVGIGTSSPGSYAEAPNLVVANTSGNCGATIASSASGYGALYFADGTTGDEKYRGGFAYYHNYAGIVDQMRLAVAGSTAMAIDSSGRVGIGTSAPGSELEVKGSSSSSITIRAASGSNLSNILFARDGSSGDVRVRSDVGNNTLEIITAGIERARIDSSGRLLVGASSDSGGALLQVNGDRVRIATAKTPASASDTGTTGEVCWDTSYIYVCTATNTWKRAALSTW